MRRRITVLLGLLFLLLSLILVPRPSAAQSTFAGKLKAYESEQSGGQVKVLRLGHSGLANLRPGDDLFVGDTVKTGPGIKAQIELTDATIITMAPDSNILIKGLMLDRPQGKRNVVMRALKGTFRFVVARLLRMSPESAETAWKDSQFTLETNTMVAGVRGTDFIPVVKKDESEIAVLDGSMNVRSLTPSQRGSVVVGAQQISSVRTGGGPMDPAPLSPDRREALLAATDMKAPITTSQGPAIGKRCIYGEGEMRRDLATGTALSAALDKAVECGMTIEEAVAAALNAGVSPSAVVYTAITEGYPANKVVESAVLNGAPLRIVTSAALAAGGDKQLVFIGATDAGIPPLAVAGAMSVVIAGGPPEAPPVQATLLMPIGGGGGVTPSDLPASPYRP
jgi:hypothetical protein